MTAQLTAPPRTPAATTLASAAATGTLVALAGTSLVFLAAHLAGLELVVTPPGQSRGPVPYVALVGAVVAAGVAGLAGALVLRGVRHGRRWFIVLASAALVASLGSPIGAAEETSTALVLSAMHAIVAAAVVPLLARRMKGDVK